MLHPPAEDYDNTLGKSVTHISESDSLIRYFCYEVICNKSSLLKVAFPPTLVDVIAHLLIHLVDEVETKVGPSIYLGGCIVTTINITNGIVEPTHGYQKQLYQLKFEIYGGCVKLTGYFLYPSYYFGQ